MEIKNEHLRVIEEALGLLGREISAEIINLHRDANAYRKMMALRNAQRQAPQPAAPVDAPIATDTTEKKTET